MIKGKQDRKGLSAQAATEVAVFGAIIIFLIGMIIRTTISSQYAQNQNFKAMRLAFAKSLESAKAGKTERNNASVIYIEDRLVPEFNKFGSLERTPFMAQGSGTMSHLLMYPIDEADVNNSIPKLDVFINGQYFPFTTAALRPKLIFPAKGDPWRGMVKNPFVNRLPYMEPGKHASAYAMDNDVFVLEYSSGWDFQCKCDATTKDEAGYSMCYACPVMFQVVPKGAPEFCGDYSDRDIVSNEVGCIGLFNWQRFDLNRNGYNGDDPMEGTTDNTRVPRDKIAWQWYAFQGLVGDDKTKGVSGAIKPDIAQYLTADIDNDRKEETVYGYNRIKLDSPTPANNWKIPPVEGVSLTQLDDMNLDIEQQVTQIIAYYKISREQLAKEYQALRDNGIVTDVMVLDNQDGDIDLTHDSTSQGTQRGIQSETAIYTRMRQEIGENTDKGTYFLVKEGKLYNPESGTFVRSVNKRDQVDLVERHVLLSNNTQRFCRGSGATLHAPKCIGGLMNDKAECEVAMNPVEVCATGTGVEERGGCFSQANVAKTCMDVGSNMMYVRSRIVNRGGHKWITDATDKRPEINIR